MQKNTILRWSGSKAKLLPILTELAPSKYARYIEPFAGSASLFFHIRPQESILGDINSCVIDVYRAIQANAHEVADLLESIPRTRDAYYTLRAISPHTLSLSERAARLIFLMKSCFNGVYRTNQKGHFNVPMGDKIYALPSRLDLLQAQRKMQHTTLLNDDFNSCLKLSREEDWIYLDPPYPSTGRFRGEYGYTAEFINVHQRQFISEVQRLDAAGRYITISYSFDEALIEALSNWKVTEVAARRTVSRNVEKRGAVKELIFTNY